MRYLLKEQKSLMERMPSLSPKLRHPDAAARLSQAHDDLLPSREYTPRVKQRPSRAVEMHNGHGRAGRPLGRRLQALRRDALESIAIRHEVEQVSGRCPQRPAVVPDAVGDLDPLALGRVSSWAIWRHKYRFFSRSDLRIKRE